MFLAAALPVLVVCPQRQYRYLLPNVFINGKPAALATNSQAVCSNDGPSMQMA